MLTCFDLKNQNLWIKLSSTVIYFINLYGDTNNKLICINLLRNINVSRNKGMNKMNKIFFLNTIIMISTPLKIEYIE